MTGKMRFTGFDAELGYKDLNANPGSVRIDVTLQGPTVAQASGVPGLRLRMTGNSR